MADGSFLGRPGDDLIQPFMIERSGIRGRLLRLGAVVDRIVTRPGYPAPVARLLAELVALGGVLASTLKYEGVFTLQIKGEGPLRTMVTDVTSEGELRGYAGYDEDGLSAAEAAGRPNGTEDEIARWFGKGHMAFTVDQGVHSERYQGLVELVGPRLADSLLHYFRQSQQLNAGILIGAAPGPAGWRAGALLIERIPQSRGGGERDEIAEEDWRRALVLMASCRAEELIDPGLSAEGLLYRLFHEDGVRVFEQRRLAVGCRCTRERVAGILGSLPREEVEDLKVGGEVVMTCEFCNIDFRFDETALDGLFEARDKGET